jgi:hypothetical protein
MSLDHQELKHALSICTIELMWLLRICISSLCVCSEQAQNFKIERGHSEHAELSVHIRIKTMLTQKLKNLICIFTPKSPTHRDFYGVKNMKFLPMKNLTVGHLPRTSRVRWSVQLG